MGSHDLLLQSAEPSLLIVVPLGDVVLAGSLLQVCLEISVKVISSCRMIFMKKATGVRFSFIINFNGTDN